MPASGYGVNIPITKSTDPRNYPEYKYQPFPRMLKVLADKEYVEAWRQKHGYIAESGKVSYLTAAPKIGTLQPLLANEDDVDAGYATVIGNPVIVRNENEEHNALVAHGLKEHAHNPKPVRTVEMESDTDELAMLRKENAALRAAAPKQRGTRRRRTQQAAPTVRVKELPQDAE